MRDGGSSVAEQHSIDVSTVGQGSILQLYLFCEFACRVYSNYSFISLLVHERTVRTSTRFEL